MLRGWRRGMLFKRSLRDRGYTFRRLPSSVLNALSSMRTARLPNFLHTLGISALITLSLVPLTADGQQYQLRHYGVVDGLAHGAVISIYQDRKGYLWFSTREGLSRFDGYTFVNYGERNGLENQLINDVTEDQQGRMWVATNG